MVDRRARIWGWGLLLVLAGAAPAGAAGPPAWLPQYDADVVLDVPAHTARVRQRVVWTNMATRPTREIVFNAHAHYRIPDGEVGRLAKMVELLRMAPSEALSFDGPALEVQAVGLVGHGAKLKPAAFRPPDEAIREPRPFLFRDDNPTALVVPLDDAVGPGEAVVLDLDFTMRLPPRKGRWGQWQGITTLAQWLPVVAVYTDNGWDPAPFVPWHQPFHNEAGVYTVRLKVNSDQKVAASAAEKSRTDLGDGWQAIVYESACVRDFTLVCSARFQEWCGTADGVKIRCLAPPEHGFYAKVLMDAVCEALPVYNRWFGRYPYPQFTFVESCFGWNGNECGGLVMIDDRMFNMPHIAKNYPIYLIQHELCHQWFYNTVGTNGYAETWMDEGLATYFSHRLADRTLGPNNAVIDYPDGLSWLPNIRRNDLRNYTLVGARARGEAHPAVQPMEKYGHLVNLTSATYDRGSKVLGQIEERLGEAAFFDFMRGVYKKYQFRILRVADFQRELEAYTRRPWADFFGYWVYGAGMCDWAVEKVEVADAPKSVFHRRKPGPAQVVVHLRQQGGFNEPTVLGVRLPGTEGYVIRVPVHPDVPIMQVEECGATVECSATRDLRSPGQGQAVVRVTLTLPDVPTQVAVDPDRVLLDAQPTNNLWKAEPRFHLAPFYTILDDADVTNAYDRWNVNFGPWAYFSSWNNPWFTVQPLAGFRASVYRTQGFYAGAGVAYRTNDRNIVAQADVLWDHVPLPNTQVGLWVEQSLATLGSENVPSNRGVVYGRYIMMYGSSLYLPPFEFVEAFGVVQDRMLPDPRFATPGADLFDRRTSLGVHYHKGYQTPYWDPEGGYTLDLAYQYGIPVLGNERSFQQLNGQVSFVKGTPKLGAGGPVLDWLHETRWAFRVGGATAVPSDGQFFGLGGGEQFRGFDLAERQGSSTWVGSVEWRVPLARGLTWDVCDHLAGIRNVYVAPFYDVGNAYVGGRALGPTAHALGAGLRVDVNWIGLIERTMLRFDVAKTINSDAPVQFWLGITHPF